MSTRLQKWLVHLAIALAVILGLYVILANVFLNTEIAFRVINRKPEKLSVRWETGWTLLPGIVHVQGLTIRGQDRKFQWYAELEEIRASIKLTALFGKRFRGDAMKGRGLSFRMRQRLPPGAAPRQDGDPTPPIPGLSNPPQPPPEELYPPRTPKFPWTLEMNNIAINEVRALWIEQFRFEGDGRIQGSMVHTIKGPVAVPQASVTLTSGNWRIGDTVVEEDVRLHANIMIDEFVPSDEKGAKVLRFISGSVRHRAEVKDLHFLKFYFRKTPWLKIGGGGVLDSELRLEKGVVAPGTRVSVETAGITTNVIGYTTTTKGSGKVEGRVALENGKRVAKLSVTLQAFEVAHAEAEKPLARGRDLQIHGTSAELDLRDPFTDLTLIVSVPDAELFDLRFFNTLIPQEMGVDILAGSGRVRTYLEGSPQKRIADGEIELLGQGLVAQYKDLTVTGDLKVKANLQYGVAEDDEGLTVFSEVPFEVSKLSLALTSAELRDREQTVADDLTLEIQSAFDVYTLDLPRALSVLRFTSGSMRVGGTIPDLRYVNGYLPPQTRLHIRSGTGRIQTQFDTVPGQPDLTGSFTLMGEDVTAAFEDLDVAGNIKVSADLQYGLQAQDDNGLVVFSEQGRLEVLKASIALASGKVRDQEQLIAENLTLAIESKFDQYTLDTTQALGLLPFTSASARISGRLPDVRYLNDYIPQQIGLRLSSGAGQFQSRFETPSGASATKGSIALTGKSIAAKFRDVAISGDLKVVTDIQYGRGKKRKHEGGLVVLTKGPLTIPKASFELTSGKVLLRDGNAIRNLALKVDSSFDHFVLQEQKAYEVLRSISGSVRLAGQIPSLRFLKAYFRKAPWLDIKGSGSLNADMHVRKGRLIPGSRLAVDSEEILATYLDFKARGSGRVRGRVVRKKGRAFAEITVALNDFEVGRLEYLEPHIFGIGFKITGTSSALDLTDPFTDLKVVLDMPESDVPHFSFYNAYIPPDSCFFIHSGHGRIRSYLEASAKELSAKGEVEFRAERVVAQFGNVTMAGDLNVSARLRNGDIKSRTFDMSGTKLELNNVYVGTGKIGTDTSWWARFNFPKGKGQFTTPAKLDARIEMSLRDSRPVVVFLSEKKGIVRWFKNLLTVKDIKARIDFKMDGSSVELEDLKMTGDRFEILGELDIFARQFAGVFYARLRDLSVGVEVGDGRKKFKLSKSRPWFDKRRQVYKAHKWFEKQEGRDRAAVAEVSQALVKDERKVPARTDCWK